MWSRSIDTGQTGDLDSVVTFVYTAKWTELAIMEELNRVLWENTLSDSTV
jgi:hypothetical protein